jgi:hypothetical protein
MPRMLKKLKARPEPGFLGRVQSGLTRVQYWRSFEYIQAYARAPNGRHWPARVAFNKRTGRGRGDIGIWHETYLVRAGAYGAIYSGMPAQRLGAAGRQPRIVRRVAAARRRDDGTLETIQVRRSDRLGG